MNTQTHTILVADDDPFNLELIVQQLQLAHYHILTARSGKNALDIATQAKIDLALLDINMGKMDGFEVCRQLKTNHHTQHIPIIFITALDNEKDINKAFDIGAVDYITKPVQGKALLSRVKTHLHLSQLTQNLEDLVQERTHQLEKLDRAKSDFIQIISHELRTPLAVIDGFTQMLKDRPALQQDEPSQKIIAHILQGTNRLLEIINHTLDATKIDQGSLKLTTTHLVIAEIIHQVQRSLQDALQERHLTCICDDLSTLPFLEADPSLLKKLYTHLLINAIKYTPDGGKIHIKGKAVAIPDGTQWVEIAVCDTGIGIKANDLNLIFEKFYQTGEAISHSSGKTIFKGGGPGLGLAIAKGIVIAHGGCIWAESGGYDEIRCFGSTFYTRFPIAPRLKQN